MDDETSLAATLDSYLQLDASAREARSAGFLRGLATLVETEGKDAARAYAARAVGPLLDYSSLMKLSRFLIDKKSGPRTPGKGLRLAILGGPTTTQLRQFIEVFLAGEGIAVEIYESDYGLFRQEIFTPGSRLDLFGPQVIFLATGARDVRRYPTIEMGEESVAAMAAEELEDWSTLWDTAKTRWNASIIQNNFEIAPGSVMGHYRLRYPAAREHYLERLNREMANAAPAFVILHDLQGLAAEAGSKNWFDPRFYLEFKMPCGAECLVPYAYSVVSLIRAVVGKSKKVLVLDLDNTLWGGIVGDLGPGGIRIGQGSGEGEAFLGFQHYLKEHQRRGVLLAVCSKNDEANAREPFEHRTDMVLKLADIVCFVANWTNKADNLRMIADRLDLKLDSFVFVDDNPAERAIVRQFVPEVAVPDMPEDPAGYVQALAIHRYFETVAFTREDTSRAGYYADNARRKELASRATDVRSFLASLEMSMKVAAVGDLNIERATQLVNKSNQFNLCTRRYTTAEVREIAESSDCATLTFSLRDSLGDNGLIGVLLARKHGETLAVETWVMSCRVLQRGVEFFTRNELVAAARRLQCTSILGTYIPSPKNQMVKDHYPSLGFKLVSEDDGGTTTWSLPVDSDLADLPHFITREASDE